MSVGPGEVRGKKGQGALAKNKIRTWSHRPSGHSSQEGKLGKEAKNSPRILGHVAAVSVL